MADQLTGRSILKFVRSFVNLKDSELITDEYRAYNLIGKEMKHAVINHKEQFADDETHTNTIEGFWLLLKRAWYGSHHHYTTGYTPLYVAEACYKYNTNSENTCRITGFYEMWCRTAQTKSLCYKWEIYNQKWYNQYFFNTVNPNSKRINSKKAEQKESSGCGCGPPCELVEAFEKATIIPKELLAVKVELPPTIDGNLDDPCWQNSPKAVDFTDRNTGGEPAKNRTEVRMVYTD